MPQFTVNTSRFDPYKNFKFRVKWDGRYVAGVSKISALKKTGDVVTHREGGSPSSMRLSPSTWKQQACTIAGRELTMREWADALPGRGYRRVCG